MIDRGSIPFKHWQMKNRLCQPDFIASAFGDIAASLDDLEQAIHQIVLTQKGTVPLEPEMCTNLLPYIDRPPDIAIPIFCREIFDAIKAWEPRVVVERVKAIPVSASQWRFPVFWRPRADVLSDVRMTEVAYAPY